MKVYNLVVSVLIIYFVVDTNCGVIDNVYGSIKNRTEAFKDSVSNIWSGAKDFVFGEDSEGEAPGNPSSNATETDEGGIISGIYGRVSNAFQSARQQVHDVILGSEDDNKGIVSSMYNRIKDRITKVKTFVIGSDLTNEPTKDKEAMKPIHDAVTKFLGDQKNKNNENLQNFRHRVVDLDEEAKEGVEAAKQNIDKFTAEQSANIDNSVDNVNEMTRSGINKAKSDFDSTINNLQNNMEDLSDKEKEILNAISSRLRNRMTNVLLYEDIRNSTGNQARLSYGTEVGKNQV